jgi:protease-4
MPAERTGAVKGTSVSAGLSKALRFIFWVVLPLLLGSILAVLLVPVPRVGVIRFQDVIWSGSGASLAELIDRAEGDRRIRAVVLEIDSPGGEVTATEEVYYRLLQLRESKPLVVTIDSLAASGGYYMAAAGEYVFAKPASLVGNIGVISFLPSADEQRFADEDYVATGPFKFSGGSRGDFMLQIELARLGFLEAVYAQRADRLPSPDRLAGGEVFMGVQAVELGLVDELGANSEAVRKAADLAQLSSFRVESIAHPAVGGEESELVLRAAARGLPEWLSARDPAWRQGLYYLYLEPARRPQ